MICLEYMQEDKQQMDRIAKCNDKEGTK